MTATSEQAIAANNVTLSQLRKTYDDRCIATCQDGAFHGTDPRRVKRRHVYEAAARCRELTQQLEDANDALLAAERATR